jgi:hypothetical protein
MHLSSRLASHHVCKFDGSSCVHFALPQDSLGLWCVSCMCYAEEARERLLRCQRCRFWRLSTMCRWVYAQGALQDSWKELDSRHVTPDDWTNLSDWLPNPLRNSVSYRFPTRMRKFRVRSHRMIRFHCLAREQLLSHICI